MKSFLLICAAILALAVTGFAQTPGVIVTATLVDGQGVIDKSAYLHWQLWNCGNNVPQVVGNPSSRRRGSGG